jgi:hypothetical protein
MRPILIPADSRNAQPSRFIPGKNIRRDVHEIDNDLWQFAISDPGCCTEFS